MHNPPTTLSPQHLTELLTPLFNNRLLQEKKNYNYCSSTAVSDTKTGETLCTLQDITVTKRANKYAEMNNFANAFTTKSLEDNRQIMFCTHTLPTDLQLATKLLEAKQNGQSITTDLVDSIYVEQLDVLGSAHNHKRKNRQARNFDNKFIRALELTKKLTVHSHCLNAVESGYPALNAYINAEIQAKRCHGLGRCEIRLESTYKAQIIEDFGLKIFDIDKNGFSHYRVAKDDIDESEHKKGEMVIVTFFESTSAEHLTAQIITYILKYVTKGVHTPTVNMDTTLADFTKSEYNTARSVFLRYNKRAFTYSQYICSLTDFRNAVPLILKAEDIAEVDKENAKSMVFWTQNPCEFIAHKTKATPEYPYNTFSITYKNITITKPINRYRLSRY
jgi:hypothetical protein